MSSEERILEGSGGSDYYDLTESYGIASYLWEQISGPGTLYFNQSSGSGTANDGTNVIEPYVSASDEGIYYMKITLTDNAGNQSSDVLPLTWDTTAPGDLSSITVTESNPGYTTTGQPEWSWSAVSDADYYRISYISNFSASINTSSNSYSPNTALSDGTYTLYVRAYDFAGNYSNSLSQVITIDTVAPIIIVNNYEYIANLSITAPDITFSDNSDGLISGIGTGSILWSMISGPGTITFGSETSDVTSIEADTDGTYNFQVSATDDAGNSEVASLTFTRDMVRPGTPNLTGPSLTPNRQPTWNWSGSGGGIGEFEYRLWNIDDNNYDPDWTTTTDLSYTPPSLLDDQINYQMQVREIDSAGNWSLISTLTTEVDTTQTTPAQIVLGVGLPTLRTVDTVEWDVLTGSGGIASDYRYYYDGSGTWIYGGIGLSNVTAVDFDRSGLSDGEHSLTIQEYFNSVWQTGKEATHTINVDTESPGDPILTGEGFATLDSDRTATNDNYPTWSWSTGGDGNDQFEYRIDGGSWVSTTATSYTPFKIEGTYIVEVQERDDAGNWSDISSHRITVDTTKPTISAVEVRDPTPFDQDTDYSHTNSETVNIIITGDVSGESGPVNIRYYDYNPSGWKEWTNTYFTGTSETISTTVSSTNGTKTIYVEIYDEAGNYSGYLNDSIVLDTEAPTGTFAINNGASYTPSLSFKMNLNISDNLSQVTDFLVRTYDYYGTDGDGTGWEAYRAYAALMDSDCTFSNTAGSKGASVLIYDSAGNSANIYDSITLQVPVPQYAHKGYYYTGYTNVYYNSVTEDSGTYTTRYYTYSTTDTSSDPNNVPTDASALTYEGYTTSTSYDQVSIPKGEVLYFFTRAYNADTGGYGPYSASSVMGFSSNVTIVYDASDGTDADKAEYMKELLEDTYFSGSILDESNIDGIMPTYTVTLLDEDLINNTSYSTNNTIYGDPVIVTPGTAFTRLDASYDIRARHIAIAGRGIIGMGSNGNAILDRIEENWSTWGLSGTAPSQIGSGESAGLGTSQSSKSRGASISESIWHSPVYNAYFSANFPESSITLNIFSYDVYRYGVYLGTSPVVTDGYVYAGDPAFTTYYPVVRQGRFLQYGYVDIPGRDYSGSMTYQYGQTFFINLIARMDNF